jgi:hypothetical protein
MFFVLKFELILIIGSNNVLTEGARRVRVEQGWCSGYSEGLQDGRNGSNLHLGQNIFLFSVVSRTALGPIQPPMLRDTGKTFNGGKEART